MTNHSNWHNSGYDSASLESTGKVFMKEESSRDVIDQWFSECGLVVSVVKTIFIIMLKYNFFTHSMSIQWSPGAS